MPSDSETFETKQEKEVFELSEQVLEGFEHFDLIEQIPSPKAVMSLLNDFDEEFHHYCTIHVFKNFISFKEFNDYVLKSEDFKKSYFIQNNNEFQLGVKTTNIMKLFFKLRQFFNELSDDYCRLFFDSFFNQRKSLKSIIKASYTPVFAYQTRYSVIERADLKEIMHDWLFTGKMKAYAWDAFIKDYGNYLSMSKNCSTRQDLDFFQLSLFLWDCKNLLISYYLLWSYVFKEEPREPVETDIQLSEGIEVEESENETERKMQEELLEEAEADEEDEKPEIPVRKEIKTEVEENSEPKIIFETFIELFNQNKTPTTKEAVEFFSSKFPNKFKNKKLTCLMPLIWKFNKYALTSQKNCKLGVDKSSGQSILKIKKEV